MSHTLDQQKLGEDVVLFDESPSTPKGSISSASDKKSSTLERKQGNFSSLDKKQSMTFGVSAIVCNTCVVFWCLEQVVVGRCIQEQARCQELVP